MAHVLTVRQVPEEVHQALKTRAARVGRSVEAEVRQILADSCLPMEVRNWAVGLRDRARRRTASVPQTDSAELIREGRDARGG
jgi:plasmid stability protein